MFWGIRVYVSKLIFEWNELFIFKWDSWWHRLNERWKKISRFLLFSFYERRIMWWPLREIIVIGEWQYRIKSKYDTIKETRDVERFDRSYVIKHIFISRCNDTYWSTRIINIWCSAFLTSYYDVKNKLKKLVLNGWLLF